MSRLTPNRRRRHPVAQAQQLLNAGGFEEEVSVIQRELAAPYVCPIAARETMDRLDFNPIECLVGLFREVHEREMFGESITIAKELAKYYAPQLSAARVDLIAKHTVDDTPVVEIDYLGMNPGAEPPP